MNLVLNAQQLDKSYHFCTGQQRPPGREARTHLELGNQGLYTVDCLLVESSGDLNHLKNVQFMVNKTSVKFKYGVSDVTRCLSYLSNVQITIDKTRV